MNKKYVESIQFKKASIYNYYSVVPLITLKHAIPSITNCVYLLIDCFSSNLNISNVHSRPTTFLTWEQSVFWCRARPRRRRLVTLQSGHLTITRHSLAHLLSQNYLNLPGKDSAMLQLQLIELEQRSVNKTATILHRCRENFIRGLVLCLFVTMSHYLTHKGVNGERTYIASQGPLPHTTTDFWRMLWQYKTTVVIMVCREVEMEKVGFDTVALSRLHLMCIHIVYTAFTLISTSVLFS